MDNYYRQLYRNESKGLEINKASIEELIQICRQKGIELLIVNIPELHQFKPYPFTFVTEYIRNIAEEQQVQFIDLLDDLSVHEPKSLWVSSEDPHTNVKANTIIALTIYRKIINNLLLGSEI